MCLMSVCTDMIMCALSHACIHTYCMCVHACGVHGQRPCQKPEAGLASLKCKPLRANCTCMYVQSCK